MLSEWRRTRGSKQQRGSTGRTPTWDLCKSHTNCRKRVTQRLGRFLCCCGCFLRKREQLRHSLLRCPNSSKMYNLHTFSVYVMTVQMNIFPSILNSFYFADVLDMGFTLKCIKIEYFEKMCELSIVPWDVLLSFVQTRVIFHVRNTAAKLPSYSVWVN